MWPIINTFFMDQSKSKIEFFNQLAPTPVILPGPRTAFLWTTTSLPRSTCSATMQPSSWQLSSIVTPSWRMQFLEWRIDNLYLFIIYTKKLIIKGYHYYGLYFWSLSLTTMMKDKTQVKWVNTLITKRLSFTNQFVFGETINDVSKMWKSSYTE